MKWPYPHGTKRQPQQIRWRLPTPHEWLIVSLLLLVVNTLAFWRGSLLRHPSVAGTLWQVASQHMAEPRGIVLPLFDDIAQLGVSLIMELRAMQIELPIEVAHCGDLNDKLIASLNRNASLNVRAYDVCAEAAHAMAPAPLWGSTPLYCETLPHCHQRFRSFDIKVIALLFSRFDEIMMLDADVLFLQNPTTLWDLDKFTTTGTLFFNDRISFTDQFLAQRVNGQNERSKLHEFVETFDRTPFQHLPSTPRRNASPTFSDSTNPPLRKQIGTPSEYLASTHAWKLLSGHHADSSLMLWSKVRQPRATAILGSFVTLRHAHRPPSYGDKEFYFLACEVAGSDYAFSDFGVGSIGHDARHNEGVLCGDALHFYPHKIAGERDQDVAPLYINSDHIAAWHPESDTIYRSHARRYSVYPGSFERRGLPQECPFDISMERLTTREIARFQQRQQFYRDAQELLARLQ